MVTDRSRPRPRWCGSLRARTTAASTAVVAAALLAAGSVVLVALHHHLVGRASLQAEVTARQVAAQVVAGTPFGTLDLPDAPSQPVQVVSDDARVLAAGRAVRGEAPFARFAPAPHGVIVLRPRLWHQHDGGNRGGDGDGDGDGDGPLGGRGWLGWRGEHRLPVPGSRGVGAAFRTVRLRLPHDGRRTHDFRVAAVFATTPRGHTVTVYAGSSLDAARDAVGEARIVMLSGLPLLLAVVATVTWLVTRRALRPVEAIRAELTEIMKGDLTRRVPEPHARDEVARLAATTNTTLAALERAVERQRRFVADASHELRSPIASLRTQLEVARAHPHLLQIDGLIDDTLRLERLAAGLLLLARLDAGEPHRAEPVDLAALTREELARRAADRIPVETAIPEMPVVITGSRTQLAHVLGNLVDNAQRHAASAVSVVLHHRPGDTVVLEVTDDGPGVPAADRERIFERFIRLDDARSRDDGGAGLGLAIVRDLVRRHGGRIDVSDATGGGARFTVTLRAAVATGS